MKKILSMMCAVLFITSIYASENGKKIDNIPEWVKPFKEIAEEGSPKDVDWDNAANFGSEGNIRIFFDKDGNPEVYMIGIAPVSTTLVGARARQLALKECEINAKAAFALWLNETFTVSDKLNQKTLVVKKNGTSENSEDRTLVERKVEQIASAQFRGMRVMHVVIKNNECYSVWRWSLTEHKFAQLIEILTKDGSINRRPNMDVKEGTWSRF